MMTVAIPVATEGNLNSGKDDGKSMRKGLMERLVTRHADQLVGLSRDDVLPGLKEDEFREIEPYLSLGHQLRAAMPPVFAGAEYRSRLRRDLVACASRRRLPSVQTERAPFWQNRWVWAGAAGSLLSVVGVVAVLLLHQRSAAHSKL